jgi:transcriptional regulator with XRE-family HTH domain
MAKLLSKSFGEILKQFRTEQGLSQEQLSIECELDRTYISSIERGHRAPTIHTLFKIARSLKTKPSTFIKLLEETYEDQQD